MQEFARYSVGDIINKRYKVTHLMPEGGMGCVVCVTRLKDNKSLALKYCKYDDLSYTRRFLREVRVMRTIDHPNVLSVIATSNSHRPPYFVTEVAPNSLEAEVADLCKDHSAALDAFEQLCRGVQGIHNSGAVHRDLKPANALRLQSGVIVVCDLGLAKFSERDTTILTQTRVLLGTDMYAAPEQKLPDGSRAADVRTDIYQLGKTLYQLLTGKHPILLDLRDIPAGLAHVIRKCTRDNPSDRYRSVGELLDAVGQYRKYSDPSLRPIQAAEALLSSIESESEIGRYDEQQVAKVLSLMDQIEAEDDEAFAQILENVPLPVLRVCAAEFAEQFLPIIKRYARIVSTTAGAQSFAYAEVVAQTMTPVFSAASDVDIAVLALQTILIAAVDLNRFAAMDRFNALLLSIQDDGLAVEIAPMLKHQQKRYTVVAHQIPGGRLHPAIREVRASVLKSDTPT